MNCWVTPVRCWVPSPCINLGFKLGHHERNFGMLPPPPPRWSLPHPLGRAQMCAERKGVVWGSSPVLTQCTNMQKVKPFKSLFLKVHTADDFLYLLIYSVERGRGWIQWERHHLAFIARIPVFRVVWEAAPSESWCKFVKTFLWSTDQTFWLCTCSIMVIPVMHQG